MSTSGQRGEGVLVVITRGGRNVDGIDVGMCSHLVVGIDHGRHIPARCGIFGASAITGAEHAYRNIAELRVANGERLDDGRWCDPRSRHETEPKARCCGAMWSGHDIGCSHSGHAR